MSPEFLEIIGYVLLVGGAVVSLVQRGYALGLIGLGIALLI